MRLICGVFHLDGADAREDLLRAMAEPMDVPRLRPSLRLWRDGPVGLAVLDFAALGAAAPPLPQINTVTIAADVRLDEPAELGRTLGHGKPAPDELLLLAALERFGPSGLSQLLGDFAFAAWNSSAQRLVCARDAFGIRPLSYVHRPGKLFAFASFPRALFGSGIVARTIDQDAVVRRLVQAYRSDDSLIAGIKRVPPAHYVEVSRAGISLKRYWQIDRAVLGTRSCSPDEAARELRRLIEQAVACRLPKSGSIGAHLSGGLDSSSIAVLAARRLRHEGRPLHAYSFLDRQRNDITLEDETEYVKAVVEQEGDIDWTPIRPPKDSLALGAADDIEAMTLPGGRQVEDKTCARAEQQGVDLLLSGWGGDEAASFNGRGAMAELFLHGRWRALAREVAAIMRERGWSASRIVYKEVVSYLLPEPVLALGRRLAGKTDSDLHRRTAAVLSTAARGRLAASGDVALSPLPDGRLTRLRFVTSPHLAERAENWAQIGARHGLAFAFPLLDRRVVEFALSLPSELFFRDGFRRRLFRDAAADLLPERVRFRHLKFQSFPGWLLDVAENKDELLARIEFYEKNESVRRAIDLGALRRLVEGLPDPDRLREEMARGENPAATTALVTVMQAMTAAAYLASHGAADGPMKA